MVKLINILQEIEIKNLPLIKGKIYRFPKLELTLTYIGQEEQKHVFEDKTTKITYSSNDIHLQQMFKDKEIIRKDE